MTKEKAITWGGVALLILFIASRPAAAAQVFQAIGGGIVSVATGFGDFVTNLITPEPVDPYYDQGINLDPTSVYLTSSCSVPVPTDKIRQAEHGIGVMGPVKSIVADRELPGVAVFGRFIK